MTLADAKRIWIFIITKWTIQLHLIIRHNMLNQHHWHTACGTVKYTTTLKPINWINIKQHLYATGTPTHTHTHTPPQKRGIDIPFSDHFDVVNRIKLTIYKFEMKEKVVRHKVNWEKKIGNTFWCLCLVYFNVNSNLSKIYIRQYYCHFPFETMSTTQSFHLNWSRLKYIACLQVYAIS